MAAEDYIDFDADPSERDDSPGFARMRARNEAHHLLRRADSLRKIDSDATKAKHIGWVTGAGEIIRVRDMEDSHLANTINYIYRKLESHSKAVEFMAERGFCVPEFSINKRSGLEWLDILGKESTRRRNKELAKAAKVLERAGGKV